MASRRNQSLQSEPNFAVDSFERLPRDILLPLVKLTSDFATLWSLSIVSCAVHQVIDFRDGHACERTRTDSVLLPSYLSRFWSSAYTHQHLGIYSCSMIWRAIAKTFNGRTQIRKIFAMQISKHFTRLARLPLRGTQFWPLLFPWRRHLKAPYFD